MEMKIILQTIDNDNIYKMIQSKSRIVVLDNSRKFQQMTKMENVIGCKLAIVWLLMITVFDKQQFHSFIPKMEDNIKKQHMETRIRIKQWGGILIVIFVWDDMQLLSIEPEKVWTYNFPMKLNIYPTITGIHAWKYIKRRNKWTTTMVATFKRCYGIAKIWQTIDNDNKYKMLQSKSRIDVLKNEDISEIYKYHIDNSESFTPDQKLEIETEAMFVFARKDDRNEYIRKCWRKQQPRKILLQL